MAEAPRLLPAAQLPTLPTAQLLARLSAEPGRCEMTVDPSSPWVAGVIVRTPRLMLALHAVSDEQAQIIAVPRVHGLQASGDVHLQQLLSNAAPTDPQAYRPVPPPDPSEAGIPGLDIFPELGQPVTAPERSDSPLPYLPWLWLAAAVIAIMQPMTTPGLFVLIPLLVGTVLGFMTFKSTPARPTYPFLISLSLWTAVLTLVLFLFAGPSPLLMLLSFVSVVSGLATRLFPASSPPAAPPTSSQPETPQTHKPLALPAPQQQLIEATRIQLSEHLAEAERTGNTRDAFDARQALEVHLPEVVSRWEALPSWRRKDSEPLRRTLEKLAAASTPDTTGSQLAWDATERFIEEKARSKGSDSDELSLKREPLTPPQRTGNTPPERDAEDTR